MKKRSPFALGTILAFGLALWLIPAGALSGGHQAESAKKKPIAAPLVLVDKETQAPRIIRDMEEYAPGAEGGRLQVSPTNVERLAFDYFQKNETRLALKAADLKFRRARKVGRFWVAIFRQHYRGVPVYRSRVGLVTLGDGKVISLGSNYDSKIDLNVSPKVSFESAVSAAAKSLNLKNPEAARAYANELVIYKNPPKIKPRHSLAWFFVLETRKPNPYLHKVCVLDAHSGRVIKMENALRDATLKAQVRGTIWPTDLTKPTEVKPFPHLQVNLREKSQTTGSQGRFQLEGVNAGSYDLELRLKGPYVTVYRNSDTGADDFIDNEQKLTGAVATGTEAQLDWPSSDEVNVFYHINKMRDWYLDKFDYAYEYTRDREGFTRKQVIVCCQCGPELNGMACLGGMWFGSQSGRQWARSSDVIYHEFTHLVIAAINDGLIISRSDNSEGYSMDEGFADYFACAMNDDPVNGENVSTSPRNLMNTDQYPSGPFNLEGHAGSTIISGACWDFRSSIDKKEADQIVFQALNIMAAWPPEYYFSNPEESNFLSALRMAANGRFSQEIDRAFANHGLLPQAAVAPAAGPAPRVAAISPAANARAIGPTQVVITFDREINDRTLAGNVIVEREDYKGRRPVECTVSLDSTAKKTLTIKPKKSGEGFAPLGMQTNFYVRLVSGATQSVRGTNGQMLDGDGDGQPGGDYTAKFWVID